MVDGKWGTTRTRSAEYNTPNFETVFGVFVPWWLNSYNISLEDET